MIKGNTKGIKNILVNRLNELENIKPDPALFLDIALAQELVELTLKLRRELCVYVTRAGEIVYTAIGESDRASLEGLTMRRSDDSLSGIRCIHTHPSGSGKLSDIDIESLKKLKFDAICAVGASENGALDVQMAVLDDSAEGFAVFSAPDIFSIDQHEWFEKIFTAEKTLRKISKIVETDDKEERVLLIGNEEASVEELERLTDTAGGTIVYKAVQKKQSGIGKGKLSELARIVQSQSINLAIYDDELTFVQQHSLSEALGIRVIDRTTLILDIFAQRATSREGKMQVELAQLQYSYSRLKGIGEELSRQGGGIGTRGPGEEKLENDRRHIRRRVFELQEQINSISAQRSLRRKQREKQVTPTLALVGYTNAGKSTLLAALSGKEVFIEDKLFATLDPLTRRCELDKNVEVCVTDTVGFIKKLPHQLVEAFRSTLEEAIYADILLHVCDGSSPELFEQINAVESVLTEIGASDIPTITVVNKTDKVFGEMPIIKDAVYISASTGEGVDALKKRIMQELENVRSTVELIIPYNRGDVLSYIYTNGNIISAEHIDEGTKITFSAPNDEVARIRSRLR